MLHLKPTFNSFHLCCVAESSTGELWGCSPTPALSTQGVEADTTHNGIEMDWLEDGGEVVVKVICQSRKERGCSMTCVLSV